MRALKCKQVQESRKTLALSQSTLLRNYTTIINNHNIILYDHSDGLSFVHVPSERLYN